MFERSARRITILLACACLVWGCGGPVESSSLPGSNPGDQSDPVLGAQNPDANDPVVAAADGGDSSDPGGGAGDSSSGAAAPNANAGSDQVVVPGTIVEIDGSGSSDPQGLPLAFSWSQVEGPAVVLLDAATPHLRFIAPVVQDPPVTLVFELVVSNGERSDADRVSVLVSSSTDVAQDGNDGADDTPDGGGADVAAPHADAGPDRLVQPGVAVELDGSASSDPQGLALVFSWTQVDGPPVVLTDSSSPHPRFTAPAVQDSSIILVFELTVSNGVLFDTDQVSILVPPGADNPPINYGSDDGSSLFFLQAEHAAITDGGVIIGNPDASGAAAVLVPADISPNLQNQQDHPVRIIFTFALEEPALCRLYAGVLGTSDHSNSFFFRIDGAPFVQWEFAPDQNFREREVGTVSLDEGMHTITFVHCEPGVVMDYLRIEQDPTYSPPPPPEANELASFYMTTGVLGAPPDPVPAGGGHSYVVSNQSELESAIAAVVPGDEIVFRDGDYTDWSIEVPMTVSGAEGAEIVLRPESPHGVRFRGRSQITLAGDHLCVSGFDFLGTGYLALRSRGDYNRMTGNRFIACGERSDLGFVVQLSQAADYNEFDHNFFAYTEGVSVGIKQPGPDSTDPSPKHNHLHHNTFQDIERVHANGGECIMAGTAWAPADVNPGYDDDTFTRIEYNKFLRANGDIEIVSIKCSKVTLRGNAFIDSAIGHVSFRMAFGCIAEKNLLLNTADGIRLTGSGHTIVNNLMFLPNSAEALSLMDGTVADNGMTNYVAATGNVIVHNTVIGGRSAVHFDMGEGSFVNPAANNVVTNNVFHLSYGALGLTVNGRSTYPASEGYSRNRIVNNVVFADGGQLAFPADGANELAKPRLDESGDVFPVPLSGSPCLGQATPGLAVEDFLGAPRPANPDIGAFESP